MSELLDAINELGQPDHAREGRFYGFVLGKVTDIQDNLVRVKAKIGAQGDNESSDWMAAAMPGSIEATPNVGDIVIVGFIDGDPNRPFWTWTVTSNTKNRPTEHMVLGDTAWGMINYLVTQVNQLRSDLQTFVTAYNAHTQTVAAGVAGIPSPVFAAAIPPGTIGGSNAQKGKAADGSVVADKSSSEVVLSGKVKLR